MALRRLPARLTDSPSRIRSRPFDSEWARLPREEVWPRGAPGAGPWGSPDGRRSVPTMLFVGGFFVVLLGIFVMFAPLVGVGAAAMVAGAIAGIVVVRRRKGRRTALLWGGVGTKAVDPDEAARVDIRREPLASAGHDDGRAGIDSSTPR
jgi:hypothetical protein